MRASRSFSGEEGNEPGSCALYFLMPLDFPVLAAKHNAFGLHFSLIFPVFLIQPLKALAKQEVRTKKTLKC